tara:strand:+ start:2224 stop:2661 length:438 start_codon:yes stop_codon:yes gene_type:complete
MRGKLASALIDYDDLDGTYARLRSLAARPAHKAALAIIVFGGVAIAAAGLLGVRGVMQSLDFSRDVTIQSGSPATIWLYNFAGVITTIAWASMVYGVGLVADMLDRQVWLAASNEDRLAIYCRRHAITPRENLTVFDSEEDSKNA